VTGERERGVTGLVRKEMDRGPLLDPGWILPPGPFNHFPIFFNFLFCFLLNLSLKLLQTSDLIQASFCNL
jgi:hypothetical protein